MPGGSRCCCSSQLVKGWCQFLHEVIFCWIWGNEREAEDLSCVQCVSLGELLKWTPKTMTAKTETRSSHKRQGIISTPSSWHRSDVRTFKMALNCLQRHQTNVPELTAPCPTLYSICPISRQTVISTLTLWQMDEVRWGTVFMYCPTAAAGRVCTAWCIAALIPSSMQSSAILRACISKKAAESLTTGIAATSTLKSFRELCRITTAGSLPVNTS
jgi:hypothetical protein